MIGIVHLLETLSREEYKTLGWCPSANVKEHMRLLEEIPQLIRRNCEDLCIVDFWWILGDKFLREFHYAWFCITKCGADKRLYYMEFIQYVCEAKTKHANFKLLKHARNFQQSNLKSKTCFFQIYLFVFRTKNLCAT